MFEDKAVRMLDLELNEYYCFYPLEVVGRGSETQLQMGTTLNKITG